MKVSFFYTMEDFKTSTIALNEVFPYNSLLMDVALSGILFPLVVVFIAIKTIIDGYWQFALFLLLIAVITSLCSFLILPKKIQKSLLNNIEKDKKVIQALSVERFLTILDDEFKLAFESTNIAMKYCDVEKVIIKNDLIIIMNKSKIDALIPFRAFKTSSDKDLFIKKIGYTSI